MCDVARREEQQMSIPFDQQFIDMMVPHHETAIEMAKLAEERAEHPELKLFAGEIMAAQESEIARMMEWRQAWFGSEPAPTKHGEAGMADMEMGHSMMSGTMDMKESVDGLRTADPFDKAFIEAMVPHHESALEMAKQAQERSEHPEIKRLADDIIAAQTREISKMKGWLDAWY
jgi:uncharacterized protein (DUF305 family)